MTDRPSRDELVLKFFPELKEQGNGADTEGAIALNVRACEAILADLIDIFDEGYEEQGPGLLALRLFEGARQSSYVTLEDLQIDQRVASKAGNDDAASFFASAIDAIVRHNASQAALVALIDNSTARLIPVRREYPASSIQAMLEEVSQ